MSASSLTRSEIPPIYAAIDIGSNAARLLISQVIFSNEQPFFKKILLVRVPLRLGFDVFANQYIPEGKADMLIKTCMAYRNLLDAYQIKSCPACATSAMRDAKNGKKLVEKIREKANIDVSIISGMEEADVLFNTQIAEHLEKGKTYLYFDIGGGSTEITVFNENERIDAISLNIGTIRILQNGVTDDEWSRMKKWLKAIHKRFPKIEGIGSGGNINRILKIANLKPGKPLSVSAIKGIYKSLSGMSLNERMMIYSLKPDRADVIVPAGEIVLKILEWTKISVIHVPKMGLADGLVRQQFNQNQ